MQSDQDHRPGTQQLVKSQEVLPIPEEPQPPANLPP
jgi:hypothetical protein